MKYAFVNGIILDGTEHMEPRRGYAVLTNGNKIERVVPQGSRFPGYTTVDLEGKYLMPGLINLHVHLPGSGKPRKKETDTKKLVKLVSTNKATRYAGKLICRGFAKTELMSGVTTVRTVGGVLNLDSVVRDEVEAGKVVGCRILASNMAVSVPGGHMAGSLAYEATSAEEAAMYVRKIAEDKPDWIKLMITGGVLDAKAMGEPGELKMPAEFVKAACDAAHELGLKVAAHVESPEGVRAALENGVDTIEHGAAPDEEILELFKSTGAAHICTISPALPFALFDKSVSHVDDMAKYNGQIVFEGVIQCARKCLEAGIPVGLGTDTGCPYVTHTDMWRELCYFHRYCGVTNKFALYSATLGNAKIAGIDRITGSIEPGKCADLIVTEENPLTNLTNLRKIDMVMAFGKLHRNPRVKICEAARQELDNFL